MSQALAKAGSGYLNLLAPLTITTALTGVVSAQGVLPAAPAKFTQCKYLVAQAVFTYGSGGTTADAYVQTSLDEGATWVDIMNFHFLTTTATKISAVVFDIALAAAVSPTDGTLASNTILTGLLGDRFRVKVTTTGTYAGGTTLSVTGFAKG